ncbi:MAG: VWA domain-containing protein [Desulfobulbaceae bacterium]|nr:VWA domain-containing protein [Desulfobulbaceae bacterium]
MQTTHKKSILYITLLIAITITALAYSKINPPPNPVSTNPTAAPLSVSGELTQKKISFNGDRKVGVVLTLSANQDKPDPTTTNRNGVNFIIVMDRSGSMQGNKINQAKTAIKEITTRLIPGDQIGLISYSDSVHTDFPLQPVTKANKSIIHQAINNLHAGGGTNLGAGLREGIKQASGNIYENNTKLILISDGMANQGITQPDELAKLAHEAIRLEASLSTVGVGLDFNEYLMTTLADHGGGSYHFLENPLAFANTFEQELLSTGIASAVNIEVHVPTVKDITLIDGSGYPLEHQQGETIFRPGSILPGTNRRLFLTFQVSASNPADYAINGITVNYQHQNTNQIISLDQPLLVSCVDNEKEALASVNKEAWRDKVMQDDMNKLRGQVAKEVKDGKKETALRYLSEYKIKNDKVNRTVSHKVAAEAEEELASLTEQVEDTFSGAPAAISRKQKKASKTMQHQSYEGRRDIKM